MSHKQTEMGAVITRLLKELVPPSGFSQADPAFVTITRETAETTRAMLYYLQGNLSKLEPK